MNKVLSNEHLGAKLRVTENQCVLFDSFTYIYTQLFYHSIMSTLCQGRLYPHIYYIYFIYIYIYIYFFFFFFFYLFICLSIYLFIYLGYNLQVSLKALVFFLELKYVIQSKTQNNK